jgi:DNA-binding response OmpR family regulator
MNRILIVEDDHQISKSLKLNLMLNKFEVEIATNIQEAESKIEQQKFSIILLDIGLPDGNGIDFCRKIRNEGIQTPIIFLSALSDERTVVRGISSGADDYLRKPFGMEELKVRMSKLIQKLTPAGHMIVFGNLKIDPVRRVVKVLDKIISLGKKEMDILIMLAKRSGEIVTREHILNTIYINSEPFDRTVDSHMSHLRRKLRSVAGDDLQIISVYGLGYRLEKRT